MKEVNEEGLISSEATYINDTQKEYERFNIHYRIQHIMMFTSFILLVFTGWPLKYQDVAFSVFLINLMGGLDAAALMHRVSAVIMILSCVYHAAYMIAAIAVGKVKWPYAMMPTLKDAKDIMAQLKFFFGLTDEKPQFGEFSYVEKFDYLAVFWGIFIMVGSGLILWMPVTSVEIFPIWIVGVAQVAHSDEALLAALAIFCWHFYNVHLKPEIFPMSWVWLTGKISEKELKDMHYAQYLEIKGQEEDNK